MERRALMSGAGLLQAGWTRARLAAMQSGQTYVVRFEPKGSRFQVVSLDQLALPESQELPPEDPDAEHSTYDILRFFKTRLPDGVIFGRADVASSNQLTATMGSAGDGPWSSPILFRPDGTTSDASVAARQRARPNGPRDPPRPHRHIRRQRSRQGGCAMSTFSKSKHVATTRSDETRLHAARSHPLARHPGRCARRFGRSHAARRPQRFDRRG